MDDAWALNQTVSLDAGGWHLGQQAVQRLDPPVDVLEN
jgi:hypothetical protein